MKSDSSKIKTKFIIKLFSNLLAGSLAVFVAFSLLFAGQFFGALNDVGAKFVGNSVAEISEDFAEMASIEPVSVSQKPTPIAGGSSSLKSDDHNDEGLVQKLGVDFSESTIEGVSKSDVSVEDEVDLLNLPLQDLALALIKKSDCDFTLPKDSKDAALVWKSKGCEKFKSAIEAIGDLGDVEAFKENRKEVLNSSCQLVNSGCSERAHLALQHGENDVALEYFRESCQREGNSHSCLTVAEFVPKGEAESFDLLQEYFAIACDNSNAIGCFQLAELYQSRGYTQVSSDYYKQACRLDRTVSAQYCSQY